MSNLKFAEIVEEMRRLCPTMYKILAATLDVEEDQEHGNVILALIYGLIMFRHFKQLSLIQRVNTVLLIDAGSNLQVFFISYFFNMLYHHHSVSYVYLQFVT